MEGGRAFHFVTDGCTRALRGRVKAAQRLNARVCAGGGRATVRHYVQAGLVDELHLPSPVLPGSGEPLLAGNDLTALGSKCTQHAASPHALHAVPTKRRQPA